MNKAQGENPVVYSQVDYNVYQAEEAPSIYKNELWFNKNKTKKIFI